MPRNLPLTFAEGAARNAALIHNRRKQKPQPFLVFKINEAEFDRSTLLIKMVHAPLKNYRTKICGEFLTDIGW